MKLFRAQRNLYIAGFSLLLSLWVRRGQGLWSEPWASWGLGTVWAQPPVASTPSQAVAWTQQPCLCLWSHKVKPSSWEAAWRVRRGCPNAKRPYLTLWSLGKCITILQSLCMYIKVNDKALPSFPFSRRRRGAQLIRDSLTKDLFCMGCLTWKEWAKVTWRDWDQPCPWGLSRCKPVLAECCIPWCPEYFWCFSFICFVLFWTRQRVLVRAWGG